MQGDDDPLLAAFIADGVDGTQRDLYGRRPRERRISVPLDALRPNVLLVYGQLCGWALARAHVRCGDREAVAGYLGAGGSFDHAVTAFAADYADQNARDHAAAAAAFGLSSGTGDGSGSTGP